MRDFTGVAEPAFPGGGGRSPRRYNGTMPTLFISDLHLDAERPHITALLIRFLEGEARGADALYILGDLFEAWVGDDDPSETGRVVAEKLLALRTSGVPVYFQRGNRDFLLGEDYAMRAGMTILPDPAVVSLYGRPALLMHGDLLCTDDTAYQQFRAQTRDPRWQAQFLAQPLDARLAFAQQARAASQARHTELQGQGLMEAITDVAPSTVAATFARYGIDTLIHGHTHRPAVHETTVDERACRRIVLGDWYEQGSVLRVDADGARLQAL
jgi:UDP-2,3-diacylglucosamine hydrolase